MYSLRPILISVQKLLTCHLLIKTFILKEIAIKRWSKAETFTIIENREQTSKKNLTFAIYFVATPFLVESLHKLKIEGNP